MPRVVGPGPAVKKKEAMNPRCQVLNASVFQGLDHDAIYVLMATQPVNSLLG